MLETSAAAEHLPFQTAGEWAAHLRWRALFVEETGFGARAREFIGEPIDKVEAAIFRSQGSTLADRAVVLGVRRLGALSMRALSVESVLLTSHIALGLVTRSWPLAGLVVGAGYSRAFVARMCEMAQAAYGQRALLRRYGDASHVDSAL